MANSPPQTFLIVSPANEEGIRISNIDTGPIGIDKYHLLTPLLTCSARNPKATNRAISTFKCIESNQIGGTQ